MERIESAVNIEYLNSIPAKISGLFKSWHCKQGNAYNFSSAVQITLDIEKLYNPVLIAE